MTKDCEVHFVPGLSFDLVPPKVVVKHGNVTTGDTKVSSRQIYKAGVTFPLF